MLAARATSALARTFSTMASSAGPVQQMIEASIRKAFSPIHLEIENESYKHSVPKGSESHFKLFIVAEAFEGKPLIERHRMVNAAVKGDAADLPVHALSISAKTPAQWEQGAKIQSTPNCRGGSGM
jgi:stress-induced morphogen